MRQIPQLSSDQVDHFWSKVDKSRGPGYCWLWKNYVNKDNGYGYDRIFRVTYLAHRVAFFITNGKLTEGMVIDHVKSKGCTNRHCVNPAHLEEVTQGINVDRSDNLIVRPKNKSHCVNGHEFTEENTYHNPSAPKYKHCRICKIEQNKKARKRVRMKCQQ